ncbi:MAG TPA: RecX family transcriptional regulator [bacterium]|nr:RecX family transcriptional regulator [bacterium]
MLARKACSEEEIRERIHPCISSAEEEEILDELISKKYVDDRMLADSVVKRLINKGKGYHFIIESLNRRKIRENVVEDIKENFDFQKEFEAARKFFEVNIKKKKPSAVIMALKRRGFSYMTMEKIAGYFDGYSR